MLTFCVFKIDLNLESFLVAKFSFSLQTVADNIKLAKFVFLEFIQNKKQLQAFLNANPFSDDCEYLLVVLMQQLQHDSTYFPFTHTPSADVYISLLAFVFISSLIFHYLHLVMFQLKIFFYFENLCKTVVQK